MSIVDLGATFDSLTRLLERKKMEGWPWVILGGLIETLAVPLHQMDANLLRVRVRVRVLV
jgi:hypothetical protein